MNGLHVLALAPHCNPESVSTSLEAYAHGEALARIHAVTLVTRQGSEEALRRARGPFHSIEIVRFPRLERIYDWSVRRIFKHDYGSHALTAFDYPFCIAFECYAWRQLRRRIIAREFDVVLRLLPITSILPSPFASLLRRSHTPFVIGPINGGLPWPHGFSQTERQKEWISGLRSAYRFMPFARSTYRDATAIIAGSSHTYSEFSAYRDKLFFVPENGISRTALSEPQRVTERRERLEMMFVGRLVPYKACDLALRAAAPILQRNLGHFTVVGDGAERTSLERLVRSLGIEQAVSFCGMLSHLETIKCLRRADVLVFPSLREFGGGVVVEALAVGAVPIVVDFGGPGDLVHPAVGYKVPLTNEDDVVNQIAAILGELAANRDLVRELSQRGASYARERLSWDVKAQSVSQVLYWAAQKGPKPDFQAPKAARP